ncbi:MAG: hypothetical protein FWC56_05640, partial [Phycisphaerae bacterium]|nr:hypothetical protein [Phycisphaerae bacterium]
PHEFEACLLTGFSDFQEKPAIRTATTHTTYAAASGSHDLERACAGGGRLTRGGRTSSSIGGGWNLKGVRLVCAVSCRRWTADMGDRENVTAGQWNERQRRL